ALETSPGEEWGARYRASELYVTGSVGAPSARHRTGDLPRIRQQPVRRQFSTLCRRYLRVVASDRSYLRLIIAFPLLLGLIPRVIPDTYGLRILRQEPNRDVP